MATTLNIRVFDTYWTFESPPGELFDLDRLPKEKREASNKMFQERYPLSEDLKSKISSEIKYQETKLGLFKQFTFGILLPAGLLLGNTFDLDRDIVILRQEVANVLSSVFVPQEYRLIESVEDGKFSVKGRVLLKLFFNY